MATPCYISCDMFFVRIVQMHHYHNNFFTRMVADATASRSPIKRSILNVCEHLADKLDAADAPLPQHFFCQNGCRCDSESQSDKAEHTKRM